MLRGMIELSIWEHTQIAPGHRRMRKIKRIAITFPYGKHGPRILKQKLAGLLRSLKA